MGLAIVIILGVIALLILLYQQATGELDCTNDGQEQKVIRKYTSYRKGHN